MPIYEYACKACGHEFEFLQLPSAPAAAACPQCASDQLERLMSGFAVNTAEISQSRVKKAQKAIRTSKNTLDRSVADADHIREHMAEAMPPIERKKP